MGDGGVSAVSESRDDVRTQTLHPILPPGFSFKIAEVDEEAGEENQAALVEGEVAGEFDLKIVAVGKQK